MKSVKDIILNLRNPGKYVEKLSPFMSEILHLTSFLESSASLGERCYCIKNNITTLPVCEPCGNRIHFNPSIPGYRKNCSKGCSSKSRAGSKKRIIDFVCETCSTQFSQSSVHKIDGKIFCDKCRVEYWKPIRKEKARIEKYGINNEEYDQLLQQQNGKCSICKTADFGGYSNLGEKYGLVVDHCHTSGKIRGLLCGHCNRMLGMFKDNPNTMVSAVEYLSKHREIPSWDQYFINIARMVATRSKDPSTKVGAVIAKDKRIVSTGYNGFPQEIEDRQEWLSDRKTKYSLMIHAEMNAILMAKKYGLSVEGCDLYVTLLPCCECATIIIQSGIKSVKCLDDFNPRYVESFKETKKLFDQAGILYEKISVI